MIIRFDSTRACDKQTELQTDGHAAPYAYVALYIADRDKSVNKLAKQYTHSTVRHTLLRYVRLEVIAHPSVVCLSSVCL